MRIKIKKITLPLLLGAFVLGIVLSVISIPVLAEADVIKVGSFQDLYYVVAQSRAKDFSGRKIQLTNNISITAEDVSVLEANGLDALTIGSSDVPFRGEFDGDGYTISGLVCDLGEADAHSDTGLFAYTENAIIRNLTIDDADINADYRGGILAGKATNTLFENIVVKNSYMRVSCYNNALTLVTDAGLTGGGLIGEAVDCVLYNCETNNTRINNNNTAGVQALGGKGLYLGGLVGSATEGTIIEYSRAIGGEVKSSYDVAVGALGGNTLYVGGIVGEMRKGSKVIDAFATNKLYFYCATYVSVGAGNSGHIGGISGAVYGSSCELTRCHYAGEPSSKQYNAVLVIPIIQKNIGISGIADVFDGGTVNDCFHKQSVTGSERTFGNKNTSDEYGPQSDERYVNPSFWTERDYDFVGVIARSSEYSDNHFNKWVMDYEKGIPVHGLSLSATLDFPGAGEVVISETELVNAPVSTKNPYNFAVQAVNFNEKTVELTANANEGYRFVGWYKVSDMLARSLPEKHSYFADVIKDGTPVSTDATYTAPFEDNDLFIGYYQAQVVYHDTNKNVIAVDGTVNADTSDDWYDYEALLPEVLPHNAPDSGTATLIGWTTDEGGYVAITSDKLIELKNRGAFYEAGKPITKTLSLYPVYADLISNVAVIMEGHEQDGLDNVTVRDGVGSVSVAMNDSGLGVVTVTGTGTDGSFPDGYRFIGWYDENNVRVSKSVRYVLEDIDLTVPHTYTARFEYRVNYHAATKDNIDDFDSAPYAQVWHTYKEVFHNLKDVPLDAQDEFVGWYYGGQSDGCDCGDAVGASDIIVAPCTVHAHVDGSTSYYIIVKSDFPGAATVTNGGKPGTGGSFWVDAVTNEGYNFLFWGAEGSNRTSDAGKPKSDWKEISANSKYKPSGSAYSTLRWYGFEAHFSADVVFHFKDISSVPLSVTRHYSEDVFLDSNVTHTYQYPLFGSAISEITDTSVASPVDMSKSGYYFAGWLDKNSVTAEEWDYIYGTEGGTYSVNEAASYECGSLSVALANVLADDAIVTEPMDLYPVYVKINIITETDISREDIPDAVNVPDIPAYSYTINEDGKGNVTVTADIDTPIENGSEELFEVTHITLQVDDGDVITLHPDENGQVTYNIKAGPTYKFVAYYKPRVIVYHNNTDSALVYTRDSGDLLGKVPMPSYAVSSDKVFVGWTESVPEGEYHTINYEDIEKQGMKLASETQLVLDSMEFYAIYAPLTIEVNSNIDDYLTSKDVDIATVRYIERPAVDKVAIDAVDKPYGQYKFIGWYTDYVNLDNPGTLITTNKNFAFEGSEAFNDVVYTAVYRDAYEINYYGTDGNVLYTANVFENDKRTFVEIVDGSSVPVDIDAFSNIQNGLPDNIEFLTWRWDNAGSFVAWDDFCDVTVENSMKTNDIRVMNLYPVVRSLEAFDSTDTQMNCIGGSDADIVLTKNDGGYNARLNVEYARPKLTVHIEEIYYSSEGSEVVYISDTPVDLYSDLKMSTLIGTKTSDASGDAVFSLYGLLKIKKVVENDGSNGDFVFSLLPKGEQGVNPVSFVVGVDETVSFALPLGEYTITEDESWAWRFSPLSKDIVLSTRSVGEVIELENTYKNKKWFSSSDRNKNEFRGRGVE